MTPIFDKMYRRAGGRSIRTDVRATATKNTIRRRQKTRFGRRADATVYGSSSFASFTAFAVFAAFAAFAGFAGFVRLYRDALTESVPSSTEWARIVLPAVRLVRFRRWMMGFAPEYDVTNTDFQRTRVVGRGWPPRSLRL